MKKIHSIVQTVVIGTLVLVITLGCWLHAPIAFSDSERRELTQFPEISADNILSSNFMTQFEKYATDQFPMRDTLRAVKAWFASSVLMQHDNNAVYKAFGHLSKMDYPFNEESLSFSKATFDRIISTYLDESNRVFFSVIPDKNAYMAEQSGHLAIDYEAFYAEWETYCDLNGLTYIDIVPLLSLNDYYTTDTHWRQERIIDVTLTLAQAMDVTLPTVYDTTATDVPFYGVYSGQYALPIEPDVLKILNNEIIKSMTATNYEATPPVSMPIYDSAKLNGKDPYEVFLSGPLSLITIENPNATSDKELILFRDSFGSSITPLLAQGYKTVTLVDIRYISSRSLDRFMDFTNKDVLFLYSTMVLNNSKDTFK